MRITRFSSKFDATPKPQTLSWDELKTLLSTPRVTDCAPCPSLARSANKCSAREIDGWSPGLWAEGSTTRKQSDVIGAELLVFDIDHTSMAKLAEIDAAIEREGFRAILHSTHSHLADDVCVRVVLEPTRPLVPAEIVPTRLWLEEKLGLPTDPKTKDLGRLYFLPSRPAEGPPFIFAACEGRGVDPVASFIAPRTSMLAQIPSHLGGPPTRGGDRPPAQPSGVPVLSGPIDMAMVKSRLRSGKRGEVTELVRRMLKGEPLAASGGRDSAIQALAGYIAFTIPDVPLEAQLELMRESVMSMDPPESGDWLSVARDKLERGRERLEATRAHNQEASDIGRRALALDSAMSHPDEDKPENTDPFDGARVAQWIAEHGLSHAPDLFKKRWIIRHHGGNWVFCNGRYASVVPDKDLMPSLLRDLARAPVALTCANAAGTEVVRPMSQILYDYSTVARSVQASLSLSRSYYDAGAECYHEAVCPIRPELKPREHPEILEWLRLFGGDVLLDWVACVARLEKPAAALYIEGPPGTGKNVLADGLARIWHKGGASAFKNVIGSNFNDSLTRCPLIHADEGIPKTDTIIDDLRALIGSNVRDLNRKFMPVVSISGCPRLIITANNDRVLLDTGANLGPNDIEAIAQRIRQIKASREPADYLRSFREKHGHDYIESWIMADKVAECALWLMANRPVDETGRFLVSGRDEKQAEAMIAGTGQVGAVLEFLARYLSDSSKMTNPRIRPGGGRLLVNTEALADKHVWERYVPSRKIPSARLISESLRSISEAAPDQFEGLNFHVVKPGLLIEWSQTQQVGSPAMIQGRIYG